MYDQSTWPWYKLDPPGPTMNVNLPSYNMTTHIIENPVPRKEIETFKRRYLPIVSLALALLNVGVVGYRVSTGKTYYKEGPMFIGLFALFGGVHVFYTLAILFAPRFLYRGTVLLKASPWIISSLSLFILFYFARRATNTVLVYCLAGFALQLLQFIAFVLPADSFLSEIFKPFRVIKVQNMLAKIDMSDPNANLETAFGPPVHVASPIYGQAPTVIRYGSQARNVLLQQPTEIPVNESTQSQVYPNYQSEKQSTTSSTSIPFAQTPHSATPPPYTNDLPSYDSIPQQQYEKPQFNEKNKNN